ncbi:MAG: SsrA-binding protein SmpB [Candidatus Niyogibacteria bacterium]|nr:SsrA-binding protein SmpB [Candidatus Niyogibacteria bacterium]
MPTLLENRRAHFDYEFLEKFEAGIELFGYEVKALKNGRGSLIGARVLIRGGEAFVVGLDIPPYQPGNAPKDYDPARTRRLLITKREIAYLTGKSAEQGLTLVPISVYTKGNLVKLGCAVARGKKEHDKREDIKAREAKRDIERTLKL